MRSKEYQSENVLEAAISRMNHIYDKYDNVIVSFSGGKDSTAVLNIALKVARERNRLPLEVDFFDEEAIHPPTIEYVERVRAMPDIKMNWFCLQFEHRNACSVTQPFWYCWNDEEKEKWVRPLPDGAITEHPLFTKGDTFVQFSEKRMREVSKTGLSVALTGIRTQESLRRYMVIASRGEDAYITGANGFSKAHPIYDWSSEDVWLLVKVWNLDYNKTYDIYNMTRSKGGNLLQQRVCMPYGEEPLRGLHLYAECFPELWHKMLNRVDGVAAAWRYANTSLYMTNDKPDHLTWRQYFDVIIAQYDGTTVKNDVIRMVNSSIGRHKGKSKDQIPDEEPHAYTGISWKFLCKVALKGDLKGRTSANRITQASVKKQKQK